MALESLRTCIKDRDPAPARQSPMEIKREVSTRLESNCRVCGSKLGIHWDKPLICSKCFLALLPENG